MAFDVKKQGIPGYLGLTSAALALLSLLLKWVDAGILANVIGLEIFWCWLFTIGCWGTPLFTMFTGKENNSAAGTIGGAMGFLFAVCFYIKNSVSLGNGSVNLSGSGVAVFIFASIILAASGILSAKTKGQIIEQLKLDAQKLKTIFNK